MTLKYKEMVRIEDDKIIIEINSAAPYEELHNIRQSLINGASEISEDFNDHGETQYNLLNLLSATMPSIEENRMIYEK